MKWISIKDKMPPEGINIFVRGEMVHEKKILEKFANQKMSGKKPWEIRKNNCDYKVGDWIRFTVIDNDTKKPTGKVYTNKIKYVFEEEGYGLKKGYCIMTLD